MTPDMWATSNDWRAMLGRLPGIDGSRKLRLWVVACCRRVLDVAARDATLFANYHSSDALLNDYWDSPHRPPRADP